MEKQYNVTRIDADYDKGLTNEQVKTRIEEGMTNEQIDPGKISVRRIIFNNTFTTFNLFNICIAVLLISVKAYENLAFMIVIVANTLIGIIQEIRAKRMVEKLSLVTQPRATVVRDGSEKSIAVDNVVLDDILLLRNGDEVTSDCMIIFGDAEINESLLTGEPEAIGKTVGDGLFSGSFISSGRCYARVIHVGEDNYASRIASEVKKHRHFGSNLLNALNKIVRIFNIVMLPLGLLLAFRSHFMLSLPWEETVTSTAAALIGMMPRGMILLASVSLMVGIVNLGRKRTLVKEMYSMETLASVDVLCMDKTGTLTQGKMNVSEVHSFENSALPIPIDVAMGTFVYELKDHNATFYAMREHFPNKGDFTATHRVFFSSERKWSGITLEKIGSIIVGAPDIIMANTSWKLPEDIEIKKEHGTRVVLAAFSPDALDKTENLPSNLQPFALIELTDPLRPDAKQTLDYFRAQDVEVKIISGDDIQTISAIAKKSGYQNYNRCMDMTTMPQDATPKKWEEVVTEYAIFGRVTPWQKKQLIAALKRKGHTVGMVGDGVNDVLALHESDCSIAMASGSDAARGVSQLILLDDQFSGLPDIVLEGRRVVNNIMRTAPLFLTKAIFSTLLTIISILFGMPYPFIPIQLTLFSVATQGTPGFLLSFEPSKERIRGEILPTIFGRSLPTAIWITIQMYINHLMQSKLGLSSLEIDTFNVYLATFASFILLFRVCIPINFYRALVSGVSAGGFILLANALPDLFHIQALYLWKMPSYLYIMMGITFVMIILLSRLINHIPYFRDGNIEALKLPWRQKKMDALKNKKEDQ